MPDKQKQLEAFSGRERSGSPLPKSRARSQATTRFAFLGGRGISLKTLFW
jgi:hypothetical protein